MAVTNSLTFDGTEILPILIEPLVTPGSDLSIYRLVPNVTGKAKIGQVERLLGTAQDGANCGWNASGDVTLSDKVWDLNYVKHNVEFCKNTIRDSYAANDFPFNSNDMDITGTQVAEAIMTQLMRGFQRDMMDMVWWAEVSAGDNADLADHLELVNGFYKDINANTTLLLNGDTSGVTATTGALAQDDALDIMWTLFQNQPNELKAVPTNQKYFLVTGSIFTNLQRSLAGDTAITALNVVSSTIVNGVPVPAFMGIPVIPHYNWDAVLSANGEYAFAHFGVLAASETLAIGTDVSDIMVEMMYDPWEETMKVKARYGLDCKLLFNDYVVGYRSTAA